MVAGRPPFADLDRGAFEGVLDMLAGRYPSDEFAELRPRITWDRVQHTVVGREARNGPPSPTAAPSRIAGSTASSRRRAGRLGPRRRARREMVFESAVGETFVLGA